MANEVPMEVLVRADERMRCRLQVEQFARDYVNKWADHEDARAQGWAILQAAHDLTTDQSGAEHIFRRGGKS